MQALMDAARDHRLTMMEGSVLAANRSMLVLMSDLGFTIEASKEQPDMRTVQRRL